MKEERILLAHGSGGKLSHDLIAKLFLKAFSNPILEKLDDSAIIELEKGKLAFTTDSYVVNPIFFRGGDIGKLAVCGTVNDLSMSGAAPKYLSAAFVIEEGFLFSDLERILRSMVEAAVEAGVAIVTGDTKVVEKGGADRIFINTAGVGVVPGELDISSANVRVDDAVLLSGSIGDHGIAVVSEREGLKFETSIVTDCAPLNRLVSEMLSVTSEIRALRDPTRGGLAATLNEFARASNVCIEIDEERVPVKDEVLGACEMLGFDPFHLANEGKLVAVVEADKADEVLAVMRRNRYGKDAQLIGRVIESPSGKAIVKTRVGTTRILDMLVGEQLPRIC
jgi:hydrogenase expression/formation protein HypE